MTMHGGLGVLCQQLRHQMPEGGALLRGACVLGDPAVGGEAAYVADAYAVGIVPFTMRTGLGDGTSCVHAAIPVDDIVVSDALPVSLAVPTVYVGHSIVTALGGGGTVDDDFSDFSHGVFIWSDGSDWSDMSDWSDYFAGISGKRYWMFMAASCIICRASSSGTEMGRVNSQKMLPTQS